MLVLRKVAGAVQAASPPRESTPRKDDAMRRIAAALLLFAFAATARAQGPDPTPIPEVLAVMRATEAAWNAGDLEGYMAGYRRSDDLRFAGGATVTRGWEATLARYREHYPDRAAMGTLAFSDLDVVMLGRDAAYVFGRWELTRADDRPHGLFTLIFRRLPEGWRIVHDHTSSAD
jgi:ketosteroid isomerase-like protein